MTSLSEALFTRKAWEQFGDRLLTNPLEVMASGTSSLARNLASSIAQIPSNTGRWGAFAMRGAGELAGLAGFNETQQAVADYTNRAHAAFDRRENSIQRTFGLPDLHNVDGTMNTSALMENILGGSVLFVPKKIPLPLQLMFPGFGKGNTATGTTGNAIAAPTISGGLFTTLEALADDDVPGVSTATIEGGDNTMGALEILRGGNTAAAPQEPQIDYDLGAQPQQAAPAPQSALEILRQGGTPTGQQTFR